ncbi:hypothetical protein T4A_4113 [Trichinella pseudospiralis]|uniref:Uncharacterized protein n=1 Tax=Trichinella pseudospiralis TaxID=6337 RepID=A0A0V1DYH9_TRIPS|nr:hypothetical protein T4A_4113 [Trichinella pseudospiralis]
MCRDGPSWNDARLHHSDIAKFLEPEHQRPTVGGCCGRVRNRDLASVLLESLGSTKPNDKLCTAAWGVRQRDNGRVV